LLTNINLSKSFDYKKHFFKFLSIFIFIKKIYYEFVTKQSLGFGKPEKQQ